MTLAEYEAQAARTVNTRLDDRDRLLDSAAGLSEEAGEILAHVRKHAFQSRPLDRRKLTEELGDALWCLAMTARHLGATLEEVAEANLEKLRTRHPDGYRDRQSTDAP